MVVTGLKNSCFCADYGDIIVTGVSEMLTAVIYVNGINALEEIYYPDAGNTVTIRGIGEVLMTYFKEVEEPLLGDSKRDLYLSTVIKLNNGEFSKEQTVFYSRISTGLDVDFSYSRFLTRYTKKRTSYSRREIIQFYDNLQSIHFGIAYLLDGVPQFLKVEQYACKNTHAGISLDVSINTILFVLKNKSDVLVTPDDLIYYEVYSVINDNIVDEIRFINDKRHFPNEKHFLYYNSFGFTETITFTGQDKRSIELGATYAYIGGDYRKIDTLPVISNQVNSGHIGKDMADCMEDLLISAKVYTYENGSIEKEIVFTEVDMTRDSQNNHPINYTLTYRPAALRHLEYKRIIYDSKRVFDKTFDNTFD